MPFFIKWIPKTNDAVVTYKIWCKNYILKYPDAYIQVHMESILSEWEDTSN